MKKMIRRITTLALAVLMVMSLGITAFADTYVGTVNVVVNASTHQITFDLGEATGEIDAIPPMSVTGGAAMPELPTPVWEIDGNTVKVFDGWYTDEALSTPVDMDEAVNGEKILYAKWNDPYAGDSSGNYGYFIRVSKVFDGLTADKIPQDFTVSIRPENDADGTKTIIKGLNEAAKKTISPTKFEYTWRVAVTPDENYDFNFYVSEAGWEVEHFDCIRDVPAGVVKVDPGAVDLVIDDKVPECANGIVNIEGHGLGREWIVAIATNGAGTVIVSTSDLSGPVQAAIKEKVIKGNYKTPVQYHNLSDGLRYPVPGSDFALTLKDNNTISVENPSNWSNAKVLSYDVKGANNPTATLTNTYTPNPIDIPGTKTWVGDTVGDRPESITVKLLADGVVVATKEVTPGENPEDPNVWAFVFENMPRFNDDGTEIVYTVEEEVPDGYKVSYDESHLHITNELDKTDVVIQKIVTGPMGDVSKTFNFEVTCPEPFDQGVLDESDGLYHASFPLTNGKTYKLTGLKVGSTLTITETNAEGYKMYVGDDEITDGSYEYVVTKNNNDIDVIINNNKEGGTPDTGVILDSLPYVLILGVVAVGAVLLLRRRRDDD